MAQIDNIQFNIRSSEPEWLTKFRKKSWDLFSKQKWADLDLEEWRYVEPQSLYENMKTSANGHLRRPHLSKNEHALLVTHANESEEKATFSNELPIQVSTLGDLNETDAKDVLSILNLPLTHHRQDVFGSLNLACFNQSTYISIEEGACIDAPLILDQIVSSPISLLVVHLKERSNLNLVERWSSGASDSNNIHHARVICLLETGSKLSFMSTQNVNEESQLLSHHHFFLHKDAQLEATYLPLGGALSRQEQLVTFLGEGAHAKTNGLVFGHKKQVFDFHSVQHHDVPRCESDLFFRNVVTDQSKSIFVGNVAIREGASGTVANQANKNLLLSAEAEAVTTPKLEIDTEDVVCGHGATVATLSETEIFYLQSRGLTREQAIKMIVGGFFSPILERLPAGLVRDEVLESVEQRIQEVSL